VTTDVELVRPSLPTSICLSDETDKELQKRADAAPAPDRLVLVTLIVTKSMPIFAVVAISSFFKKKLLW
jgi:hypothetical protein